jgi:hypothetical protein
MARPNERMVQLLDGSMVSNYSEEHRNECEARAILNMPSKGMRQDYLWGALDERGKPRGGVLQIRGEAEVRRLEATILALWEKRKQSQSAA